MDTRLGMIRHYWPEAVDTVFKNRRYWIRKFTNWGKHTNGLVSNEDVASKEKNNDVLMASKATSILEYILHLVLEHRNNVGKKLVDDPMTLVIDTAPYTLSDEVKSSLRDEITKMFGIPSFKVRFVALGKDALTPEYVDCNFGALVFYDAMDWLAKHRDALMNYAHQQRKGLSGVSSLSSIYLVAPMLYNKEVNGVKDDDEKKGYALFKSVVRAYISLEYIHPSYMSEYVQTDTAKAAPSKWQKRSQRR